MTTETSVPATSAPTSGSAFSTLLAIFTEPAKAFAAVEKRSMIWLPLILMVVGMVGMLFFYYQSVDMSWLQDKMFAGKDMDPAQLEAAKKMVSKNMLLTTSAIGGAIGPLIMYAIVATYFTIVSKITNVPINFGKWFAFATWSSVPGLLAIPLGLLQIVLAQQGQLAPNQLNPLSLNQLFFHLDMNAHWATLLDTINVTTLWTMFVTVVGFETWTKKSRATSIAVVVTPYIVVFAIMTAINLAH